MFVISCKCVKGCPREIKMILFHASLRRQKIYMDLISFNNYLSEIKTNFERFLQKWAKNVYAICDFA